MATYVLVHGGGPVITAWLGKLGVETRFVEGLRYTDEATLDVVRAVLGGVINGEIVARGSIDHAATRDAACAILEGAREAFLRRAKMYGMRFREAA